MQIYSSVVTSKGTITLPASFRHKANVKTGSKVAIVMQGNNFIIKPLGTWEDFTNIRDTIHKKHLADKSGSVTDEQIENAKIAFYKDKFGIK